MTRTIRTFAIATLGIALLGGCTETQFEKATGKGTINALNAMPASPSVNFFIEQRPLGAIGYKSALGAQPFDDLSYTFRFEFTFAGDTDPTEIASQFIDMVADTDYTILVTGSVTAPALTVLERPERQFDGTETVFEVTIAHLSPGLGDVDIYVAPTGTVPILGEERAKLRADAFAPPIDLEAGNYEVIITARDDPATILYRSFDTVFAAQNLYTLAIFDADPSITSAISVRSILSTGTGGELPDSNSPPTLRTVHAAFGTQNIDIYDDPNLTSLIFSDLAFRGSTGALAVADGTSTYTYTAVGNPGAVIDAEDQLIPRGSRVSTFLVGAVGTDLSRIALTDTVRPIETHAKLRIVHAAANIDPMDIYLVDAGTDITGIGPSFAGATFGFVSNFAAQAAGMYDLVLTLPDDKNPVATPVQIDLATGDVVEVLILDTVDPTVADTLLTVF